NDVTLKMPAFEWVHVQLHQQKGMISLSPPTICNSAQNTGTMSCTSSVIEQQKSPLISNGLGPSPLHAAVSTRSRKSLKTTIKSSGVTSSETLSSTKMRVKRGCMIEKGAWFACMFSCNSALNLANFRHLPACGCHSHEEPIADVGVAMRGR
ncbi:hypothetical protein, partial [Escherichia coli]